MGAFNWIVFTQTCPYCGSLSRITAQTHVASSFLGDESGRFQDRFYRLNEKMAWLPTSSPMYEKWSESAVIVDGKFREACYATCEFNDCELFAIIEFESTTPKAILEVGKESEWPQGYPK